MKTHPPFTLSEETSEKLLDLLEATTLGTSGARYRHLDTREKIKECDRILHLSMERNGQILANVSFCRREPYWYIRYFAFSEMFQGAGLRKSARKGMLKRELEHFFVATLNEENGHEVRAFYAYIDPRNTRSLWMSENFGFKEVGQICTQTFSRINPKIQARIARTEEWEEVKDAIEDAYGDFAFYSSAQLRKGPFYILRSETGQVIAGARFYTANWQFERLPGKYGALLTKWIPRIPGIRKILRPAHHAFLVPEAVFVKDNDPKLLEVLFEGMLYAENKNLLLWWTDEGNPLYQRVKDKAHWGLSHRFMGVHHAHAVALGELPSGNRPVYCVGLDFI